MESPHKQDQAPLSESEQESQELFQGLSPASIQLLQLNYHKQLHARQLSNYCWRCHHTQLSLSYLEFKNKHHPELTQPQISSFYPNDSFPQLQSLGVMLEKGNGHLEGPFIGPVPKTLKNLLDKVFQTYGYVPNFERFLLFYPIYLEKHLQLEQSLFQGDKIDRKIAYFLAFSAAAQKGSVYMMIRYYRRFQAAGGDNQWINLAKYPAKYKKFLTISRLMAKALWKINQQLLQDIMENSGQHWSKSQLAICIEILSFAQQNSTIALAMGLLSEQSTSQCQFLQINQVFNHIKQYQDKYIGCTALTEKLNSVIAAICQYKQQENENQKEKVEQKQSQDKKREVRKSKSEEQGCDYMKEIGAQLTKQDLYVQISKALSPLLELHQVIPKRREQAYPDINSSEYTFIFNAFPTLSNLTHKIADNIKNLITYSETMTRDNFGTAQMSSTKQFRKAMRFYAQNLCGYRHSQYNFKNMNTFLTIALKFYVRLLAMSPVNITQQVIREIQSDSGMIECFDLGHVAVLIACSKMSLDLTLIMRNIQMLQNN